MPHYRVPEVELWIWVWWFESTGANSLLCTAFTRWRCADGCSSDPDDRSPGTAHARAGRPDSADGVLRPPRVGGGPASPLPGVRPLHLYAITALARHSLLARRRRARRRRSPTDPSGLGRRRPAECRPVPRHHCLPPAAGGIALGGGARASRHGCPRASEPRVPSRFGPRVSHGPLDGRQWRVVPRISLSVPLCGPRSDLRFRYGLLSHSPPLHIGRSRG